MESCFFSAPIEPPRNGIENVYRSWTTSGAEEPRRPGLNGAVALPHVELDSRSTATSSYSYTTCPQPVNNLSLRKDESSTCGDYFSNGSQHLFGLPRPTLPVGGKPPSALSASLPHQPANLSQTLHRPTPASVHGSAFTQSVPRSPTKWPPTGAAVPHYNSQAEADPNATTHTHRGTCTGEWQYTAHQTGYPTYHHQLNTSGCLGSFGAPPRDHFTGASSSLDEIHRGREGGGCTVSASPCTACGDILCPNSHPLYPSELNTPCPRSPSQSAVAIRPCSSLSFPTYAAGPPPALGAAESDALVRYRWPASAPVYFYSKLVSASKPDGLGGVSVGVGVGPNVSATGTTSASGGRGSKSAKQPTNYRSKGTNLCNICGKSYARPSTLKTHLRTHSGEKPYRCPTCNKAFSQTANLTAHMRTHSGEKPFQCAVCHRQFSQSSSVTTHMRTHSGERPYRCAYCKKAFADSSTLTKHLRIHSGEKPYQCSMCLLRFSQSGNLTRHMKIHQHL